MFICDLCEKERKGEPYRHGPEGIGICFLCTKETERANDRLRQRLLDEEMARINEYGEEVK